MAPIVIYDTECDIDATIDSPLESFISLLEMYTPVLSNRLKPVTYQSTANIPQMDGGSCYAGIGDSFTRLNKRRPHA